LQKRARAGRLHSENPFSSAAHSNPADEVMGTDPRADHRVTLGSVVGHGATPRADRISRHVADRAAQRHSRPYDDAVVPKLHPDYHDYFGNQPVHNAVAQDSHGNISGRAAHKDKWEHYASRNSEQREHPNAAKVTRDGSVARGDLATDYPDNLPDPDVEG
jgi:hypothetical protein